MTIRYNHSVCHSLEDISSEDWNCLANPSHFSYDPFLSYDFFYALESSGSACDETGWRAHHLLLHDEREELVGIMPLYIKNHSQGEYVFDHGWAEGYEAAGGRYYPKLLCAVPFTPVMGRRIFSPQENGQAIQSNLIEAALSIVERYQLSSIHINFMETNLAPLLESYGFLLREDTQFHWQCEGYTNFDDFLATLTSRKRKVIKRERKAVLANDIDIEWVHADNLKPYHWDAFYSFYQDTGARKWGMPYLTPSFFDMIGNSLRDDILLIMAKRDGRYIAGALNFIGTDTLYGRYWGALEHHDFLHFEICYYQAIDYALANGITHVEAGAQGEHKLARGYGPKSTNSAHYIAHKGLREAVREYLIGEGQYKQLRDKALSAHLPYKRENK